MNLRYALLFCATLAAISPCFADAATPALKARLRAQITQLAAQLTNNGANAQGDDKLALPMAQLGDAATASRLATMQSTRDEIAQWRAQQRAMRGDWPGASQAATRVGVDVARADGFLVIARLAADKADFAASRAALTSAMRVLNAAPNAGQLAYAGWLWWRVGDVAAARRVFIGKAWPAALREDEAEAKQYQLQSQDFVFSKRQTVLEFAALCGLLSEMLQRFDAENELPERLLLPNISTPGDLQFLVARALSKQKPQPAALYEIAFLLARSGKGEQARQLRQRARETQTTPNGDPSYRAYLELLLAAELDDDDTFAKIADNWKQLSNDKRASEELEGLPQLARIFRPEMTRMWQLRPNALRAAVDEYADLLLRQPDLLLKFDQALPPLLDYYASRDSEKTRSLATALAAQIAVAGARNDKSSWQTSLVAVAVQLRDAGNKKGAEQITKALVAHTPDNFRPFQAVAFMQAGFLDAARQTFAPLQRLRKDQDLINRINAASDAKQRDSLERQQNSFDWGYYAENEARYVGPDAPASYFGAIEDPQQRIKVLQSWTKGLLPQLELSPPYVKYTLSNGGISEGTRSSY